MNFLNFLDQLKTETNSDLLESVIKPAFIAIHEGDDSIFTDESGKKITSADIKEDIQDDVAEIAYKKEIADAMEEMENASNSN